MLTLDEHVRMRQTRPTGISIRALAREYHHSREIIWAFAGFDPVRNSSPSVQPVPELGAVFS